MESIVLSKYDFLCWINVREYRRGNTIWTIQRNWILVGVVCGSKLARQGNLTNPFVSIYFSRLPILDHTALIYWHLINGFCHIAVHGTACQSDCNIEPVHKLPVSSFLYPTLRFIVNTDERVGQIPLPCKLRSTAIWQKPFIKCQ
jgi:hypothetical protein